MASGPTTLVMALAITLVSVTALRPVDGATSAECGKVRCAHHTDMFCLIAMTLVAS